MGCNASDYRNSYLEEITAEEVLIRTCEKRLKFSHKTLLDLFEAIEAIRFPLDHDNLVNLCLVFHISSSGLTSRFLDRLISQQLLLINTLKALSILLSRSKKIPMESLVYSSDKKTYLENVAYLLEVAVYLIPLNLEIRETRVGKYAEKLRWAAERFLGEMSRGTVPSIRDRMELLLLSTGDIRVQLYSYYVRNKKEFRRQHPKQIQFFEYESAKTVPIVDIHVVTRNCEKCRRDEEEVICGHLPEDTDISMKINEEIGGEIEGLNNNEAKLELNLHLSTNSCERSTESPKTDRLSTTAFDSSLARFTRRMSEIYQVRLQDFKVNRQSYGRFSLNEPIDFLLKLKGIESETTSIDLDRSPVRNTRRSITGLDFGIIQKIQKKRNKNSGGKYGNRESN